MPTRFDDYASSRFARKSLLDDEFLAMFDTEIQRGIHLPRVAAPVKQEIPTDPRDQRFSELTGRQKVSRIADVISRALLTYSADDPARAAAAFIADAEQLRAARARQKMEAEARYLDQTQEVGRVNAGIAAEEAGMNQRQELEDKAAEARRREQEERARQHEEELKLRDAERQDTKAYRDRQLRVEAENTRALNDLRKQGQENENIRAAWAEYENVEQALGKPIPGPTGEVQYDEYGKVVRSTPRSWEVWDALSPESQARLPTLGRQVAESYENYVAASAVTQANAFVPQLLNGSRTPEEILAEANASGDEIQMRAAEIAIQRAAELKEQEEQRNQQRELERQRQAMQAYQNETTRGPATIRFP